jgi:Domain of unknown function (DUF397)
LTDSRGTHLWRKSSRCDTSACVEIATAGDAVLMRNSTTAHDVLSLPVDAWRSFVNGVKHGDFGNA